MKYISDVELMTRFEMEFGLYKADLLENIKRVIDQTPGVKPEEFSSTCQAIAAVIPEITSSIVALLPTIIEKIDQMNRDEKLKNIVEQSQP